MYFIFMNEKIKLPVAVVVTAVVVGCSVAVWQVSEWQPVVNTFMRQLVFTQKRITPKTQPAPSSDTGTSTLILTKEALVSGSWGQEGPYGLQISFHPDGTYEERAAGETGQVPVSGVFEIQNNAVTLTPQKYGGEPFDVAKKKYGMNVYEVPVRTLTIGMSNSSLLFTTYLENKGMIEFWDRSTNVPAGVKREYKSYILETITSQAKPKSTAVLKSAANSYAQTYRFVDCDPTCEKGADYRLSEVFSRVVARTQFTESLNGVDDYWYVAQVVVPWYSIVKINNKDSEMPLTFVGWIHGSELVE